MWSIVSGMKENGVQSAARPSPVRLTAVMLRVGAVAFGGLGGALSILERELVVRRAWVREQDLRDALTYTKPLPGSTVVQVVTFLGWRVRGVLGALLATVAFVLPAAVLMGGAAAVSASLPDTPAVRGGLLALQAVVVGLLAATTVRLLRSEAASPWLLLIAALALGAGLVVNAAVVVGIAGALGVTVAAVRRRGRNG